MSDLGEDSFLYYRLIKVYDFVLTCLTLNATSYIIDIQNIYMVAEDCHWVFRVLFLFQYNTCKCCKI